ncbi:MAG: Uma2 family endonuclease [Pyrinomonadaceae bacterium MAG19_C2-C3]|nr:Uma2 family endonuclease [Pyrinomonadaceae bacterium MAG19_C2-C3]
MSTVLEHAEIEHALISNQSKHIQSHAPEPALRLITVEEYYRMGEAGIFDEDGQVELFQGRIYKLSPKNPMHSATVDTAGDSLKERLGKRAIVRTQEPIHFGSHSEPEPDVAVLEPREDRYSKAHPTPEDCLLLVEVSLSTLKYDREKKGAAYAAAGVPQYLILNLAARELEDYREPSPEGYRYKHLLCADESFNLVAFPEVEIKVGGLLLPE